MKEEKIQVTSDAENLLNNMLQSLEGRMLCDINQDNERMVAWSRKNERSFDDSNRFPKPIITFLQLHIDTKNNKINKLSLRLVDSSDPNNNDSLKSQLEKKGIQISKESSGYMSNLYIADLKNIENSKYVPDLADLTNIENSKYVSVFELILKNLKTTYADEKIQNVCKQWLNTEKQNQMDRHRLFSGYLREDEEGLDLNIPNGVKQIMHQYGDADLPTSVRQ